MRQAALVIGLALALSASAALAADGKPKQRHTPADMARARVAAIRASDLGAGWKADRSQSGGQSSPRCSTYNPDQSDLVETGKYDSPDFTRADGSFVSSTTGVFRTAAMARTGYARVARPALPECFGELFRKGTGHPQAVKILSSGPMAFPRLGDRSNAYRLRVTYAVSAATKLAVTVDMVLFNRGRTDVGLIFLAIGRPFPGTFERALAARVASRTTT